VAILDKAEAVQRKQQRVMERMEAFLRSVFLDMFGDPATNPKGWELHELGKYIKFITSGSRGWAQYYVSEGTRFIRSLDVQMNQISDEESVYVNTPNNAEANRTRVEPGDVLLTITGSRIGRVAAVPSDIGEAYISQHVAIIRLNEKMRPRFLSMFLSNPRGGQYQIPRMQYGQTKPGLNLTQIRLFKVPCPPLCEQDKFLAVWDRFNAFKEKQRAAINGLSATIHSLSHLAFRGELTGRAADEILQQAATG
jgi:type I restriction enzyme, S subunit